MLCPLLLTHTHAHMHTHTHMRLCACVVSWQNPSHLWFICVSELNIPYVHSIVYLCELHMNSSLCAPSVISSCLHHHISQPQRKTESALKRGVRYSTNVPATVVWWWFNGSTATSIGNNLRGVHRGGRGGERQSGGITHKMCVHVCACEIT